MPAVFHLVTGGDDHILSTQTCVRPLRKPHSAYWPPSISTDLSQLLFCALPPRFLAYRNAAAAAAKALRFQAVGGSISEALLSTDIWLMLKVTSRCVR